MKILEATTVFSFLGGVALAECIPLCVLCIAVSFACGYICAKLEETDKNEEE